MDKAKIKAIEQELAALHQQERLLTAAIYRKQVSPAVEAAGFVPASEGFFHPSTGAHLSLVISRDEVTHLTLERIKSRDDGKANRRNHLRRVHRLPREIIATIATGEGLTERLQEKLSSTFSAILQGKDVIKLTDSFNQHHSTQRGRRLCRRLPSRLNTFGWKPAKV